MSKCQRLLFFIYILKTVLIRFESETRVLGNLSGKTPINSEEPDLKLMANELFLVGIA